ncbi:hypothetical protein DEO72_LG8g1421 [Vigna unguiculata]|uniref:Uncharacterized protein n=1 Tax=Vigna unguiculata TaxID=3917 RepID=A0A4D6MU35_VIGUN|nr:hypothetical protein DEO72_LG8g1421 [Vigna unguiculata]
MRASLLDYGFGGCHWARLLVVIESEGKIEGRLRGSGIEQRQQKKLRPSVGGDGAGEGEGEGLGLGLGFLVGRGFGVFGPVRGKRWRRGVCGAGRVIWGCVCAGRRPGEGSVCVREEGEQRVCGRFGEMEKRWSSERVFKNENRNARTAVWEIWQLAVRVGGKDAKLHPNSKAYNSNLNYSGHSLPGSKLLLRRGYLHLVSALLPPRRTRYPDCVSDVGALGGLHLQRFPDSAESGHMEYSPDRFQGKSSSRLRLDQVQRRGPPATPHDIIHSALSELE